MSRWVLAILAVACVAWVGSGEAQAARFTSPQGFSLEYPDGWVVASKENREEVVRAAKYMSDKLAFEE